MAGFKAVLNGNLYDITTMKVSLNGTPITRGVFSELNWEADQTSGKFDGNSETPAGRTPGHSDGKGSFKMLVSFFDDFAQQLINLGYLQVTGVDFNISLTYVVNQLGPTAKNNTRSVELIGCRIETYAENVSGTDPNVVEASLVIDRAKVNGNAIWGGVDDAQQF